MFRVRREQIQRADRQAELIAVRELPHAHAQGHELVPRDGDRAFHDVLADVVHALRGRVGRGGAARRRVSGSAGAGPAASAAGTAGDATTARLS